MNAELWMIDQFESFDPDVNECTKDPHFTGDNMIEAFNAGILHRENDYKELKTACKCPVAQSAQPIRRALKNLKPIN